MFDKYDLTGKIFGLLKVCEDITHKGYTRRRYLCKCRCGKYHETYAQNLKNGKSTSCGCQTSKKRSSVKNTHKMTGTPVHRTWSHMKQRCLNPNNDRWGSYGGRGITICERWLKFENFYEDMGNRPEGKSIDRIDNDKGYYPENCKWSTPVEQMNNRRPCKKIEYHDSVSKYENKEYKGEEKTLTEWCRVLNLKYGMVSTRLKRGWPVEKAFETPCDANQIELTLKGKTKTIKEWREKLNADQSTLYTRWIRGWSDEKILTTPVKTKQVEYAELEYKGKIQSLSVWCKELNLDRRIMWKRLKRGWTVEDTFETRLLDNALKLKNIKK